MGMTFYTRGLALDSRHPRFIPLRIADSRPRLVATCTAPFSPVVKYHGLARRHVMPPRFLMRPLLNGGTLGGPRNGTRTDSVKARCFLVGRRPSLPSPLSRSPAVTSIGARAHLTQLS